MTDNGQQVYNSINILSYINIIIDCLNIIHRPSSYSDELRAERPEFNSRQEKVIFLYSIASRLALGPIQARIRWVPEALSSVVKRLRREAGHSQSSSAKFKNGGAMPPPFHMSSWRCDD